MRTYKKNLIRNTLLNLTNRFPICSHVIELKNAAQLNVTTSPPQHKHKTQQKLT